MKNEQIDNLRNKIEELLKSTKKNTNIDALKKELLNIVNELSNREEQLELRSKSLKNREINLAESETKMLTILKTLPELLFHFDNTGKYISFYQNKTFLLENPNNFLGKTVYEVLEKELADELMNSINQTLKNGSFEHNYSLNLDKKRYFSAKYSKLNDTEVIALVSDVTTKYEAKKTISTQNKELKLANETKDKFFRIIGHDLKAPFNSILGFSGLLVKNIDKYDKTKIKKYVENINSASTSTYNLIENLLEWARAQQGKTPYEPHSINLNKIIQDIVYQLNGQLRFKQIKLYEQIDTNIYFMADEEMMKTVFRNLISNAIKFTPDKGTITISSKIDNEKLHVKISDSGIGMDEEIKNNLFKIGKTISLQGTNGEEGTGFGLMISNEFIKIHQGEIKVESELNKGSSFTLILPIEAIAEI